MKLNINVLSTALLAFTSLVASQQYISITDTTDPTAFNVVTFLSSGSCTYTGIDVSGNKKKYVSDRISCVDGSSASALTYTFAYQSDQEIPFSSISDDLGNTGTCVPNCECQKKRDTTPVTPSDICPGQGCSWRGGYDCTIPNNYVTPVKTTTTTKKATKTTTRTTTRTTTKKNTTKKTSKKCSKKTTKKPYIKTVTKTITKTITKTNSCDRVCTSGLYYHKGNGKGPQGACCYNESDCVGDCRSHRCT